MAGRRGRLRELGYRYRPLRIARGMRPDPPIQAAFYLPDECQLRNPRHLQALVAACEHRGVVIHRNQPAEDFKIAGGRVQSVRTPTASFSADSYCIAAGAWSGRIAARLGVATAIKPIRGQIAVWPSIGRFTVVNEGRRYLVPRRGWSHFGRLHRGGRWV